MNKTVTIVLIAVVGLLIVGGAGYYFLNGRDQGVQETATETIVGPSDDEESLSGQESEVGVKQISMTSSNFSFNPNITTVNVGEPVRITFQNSGTHTFTIDELGINQSLSTGTTVEFTPTQAGTYEYYCAIPGHRERGMLGSLSVN